MAKINIPFGVVEQAYSNLEMRAKDAVLLETLQRIANSLEDIQANISSEPTSTKK